MTFEAKIGQHRVSAIHVAERVFRYINGEIANHLVPHK
jgi:hypothetical protein